ncbi:hypothetical protein HF521_004922 [Silurus meridionalis]|uniref:Ig-like domain-containing protein n=1 Tax=Silurus meridionalis TaxID=175797 RepID=A0A8T0AY34_SILME|nr:hypothetical protein HF521_004922 [Silurus meridionalis]
MTSSEWTGKVKCTFTQKDFTDSKEAVYGEAPDTTTPKVEITPPSTKDMLLLRSGKLVCSVNDINGFKSIKWLIGDREIPSLPRQILSKSVQLTAKIDFEEWRNGTKYTCEVEHSKFPQQFEREDFTRETGCYDFTKYIYYEMEIEEDNIATTAITFVFLFIITLFYSIGVTVIKVK